MKQANVLPTGIIPYKVDKLSITNGSATTVAIDSRTKLIEIISSTDGLYMRYQSGTTDTVFDEFINSGLVRHYINPEGVNEISLLGSSATSVVIVIQK